MKRDTAAELKVHRMGIDTYQENVVYMRRDCDVCRAEGYVANTRLQVQCGEREIIATLNVVDESVLDYDSLGFSKVAWERLGLQGGEKVRVNNAPLNNSMSFVRKMLYGHELSAPEVDAIIQDVVRHHYSDIEIASFLTACAGDRMSEDEVIALTRSMVNCGERLNWNHRHRIYDKHCIGGLPGNRTTPLVIAICSAAGLRMPKTSSRSITSPAGTADTMEVLTHVELDVEALKRVVEETNACLAWGGAVNLSPADDILIRIERALDLDSEGQLIASVLSKKVAAGSTDVLIDIPVGATAKVRSREQAKRLTYLFEKVGTELGIRVRCVISDGSQAVGNGIGPAEEARDVLAVLQNAPNAPNDLRQRALMLSTELIAVAESCSLIEAEEIALDILQSGKAWQQFRCICEAQGGLKEIPVAPYSQDVIARHGGTVTAVDNRRLAKLAKLAGAPFSPVAGLRLYAKLGERVEQGETLFTLYAATPGQLTYAMRYFTNNSDLMSLGDTGDYYCI